MTAWLNGRSVLKVRWPGVLLVLGRFVLADFKRAQRVAQSCFLTLRFFASVSNPCLLIGWQPNAVGAEDLLTPQRFSLRPGVICVT